MKISYRWLMNYTALEIGADRIAEMLTGCGLEVESTETYRNIGGGLDQVVIGEVVECFPHPDSDHLKITRVNTGQPELLQVVCGASNVASGQKVVVAMPGARLFSGDKEIIIGKTRIRGEFSEGMICAEDELGISDDHSGIMVLSPDAVPGTSAKEYFDVFEDIVFTIGLTPNRTDATSHTGVARDLIAVFNNAGKDKFSEVNDIRLIMPDISTFREGMGAFATRVVVEDTIACIRYSGLNITGITVTESPGWLKNFLQAVGIRPINNVVDVTNFILMELGQPLHAFNTDKIAGNTVVVRKSKEGARFLTLDGIERILSAEDLMICDAENPMCIGGVFGGWASGVTVETKNIFLESACFDPLHIRKTSRRHALQTDASFRFERGTDPEMTIFALKRAALLITMIAGGSVSSRITDIYPVPFKPARVRLSYDFLDRIAGKILDREVTGNILKDLGIGIEPSENGLMASVPGFKVDVNREADLAEEILRIYGYNNIGIPEEVHASLSWSTFPDRWKLRSIVSEVLCSQGFTEIMNNSLTRSSYYESGQSFPREGCVMIMNPLSRELDAMRQTLLFGGLESITYNRNRKVTDLKFFEFGSVYIRTETQNDTPVEGILEKEELAVFLTGRKEPDNWNSAGGMVDHYDIKGIVTALFCRLGLDPDGFSLHPFSSDELTDGTEWRWQGKRVGVTGEVRQPVLKVTDCKAAVFYACLDWTDILKILPEDATRFRELPKYPEVRRDLALLLDQSVTFETLKELAYRNGKSLLRQVILFDVYEGEKIEAGKKSYAIGFILRDDSMTLTDQVIDGVMAQIVKAYTEILHAQIR